MFRMSTDTLDIEVHAAGRGVPGCSDKGAGGADADMGKVLDSAIKERDEMISHSSRLREFQKEIDRSLEGSQGLSSRLISIAGASRRFKKRREVGFMNIISRMR